MNNNHNKSSFAYVAFFLLILIQIRLVCIAVNRNIGSKIRWRVRIKLTYFCLPPSATTIQHILLYLC